MRIKKEIQEQWGQPVSGSDAWKTILFVVVLLAGMLAFGQIVFATRFERLGWAVSLLVLWAPMAEAIFKRGWQVLQTFQTLFWVGYTFFAGGNILPHGTAASWLTGIGALLLIGAGMFTFIDFRKTQQPASTDAVPPAP